MPVKGQVLKILETGDMYEFLETAEDSAGQRVSVKMTLKSKGALVPDHLHSLQEEYFEVISGKLTILLDGKEQVLESGQQITLPKNKAHNHYNNSDETLVFVQTVSPALDFDYFLENIAGLANDGKMANRKTSLIQDLVTIKYLDSKSFLAKVPVGLQKVLMHTVAPPARLFGYRALYKQYTGIEK